MRKPSRKPQEDRAVRVNLSLHPTLLSVLPELLKRGGYSGLSDYVQARIRRDAGLESQQVTVTA